MPAGGVLITGSVSLRYNRESIFRQGFNRVDVRNEPSRPLNGYKKIGQCDPLSGGDVSQFAHVLIILANSFCYSDTPCGRPRPLLAVHGSGLVPERMQPSG